MSNAVVVRQGKPSAPGEKVDINAAPVVDAHATNKAALDAALLAQDEGKSVERKQEIAAKATAMTGPTTVTDRLKEQSKQRSRKTPEQTAAEKARKAKNANVTSKGSSAKAKPAAATKGRVDRLTNEWTGKDGKDIAVKDRVKTSDGIVLDVVGRWTKKGKDGNVPMVTGHIVSLPTGKGTPTTKKVGDRCNAVAAEATHVKE